MIAHCHAHHQARTERAFSLSDLVGLLGALSLVAMVVLGRMVHAGQGSRTLACVANQQALGRIWALYAYDHSEVVANNLQITETQDTVNRREYATWANNVLDWASTPFNTNLSLMATGQFAVYLDSNPGVFKCPADKFPCPFGPRVRSVSMNTYMSRPAWDPSYEKYSQLAKPAMLWVFVDEHPDSINDGVFSTLSGSITKWNDLPASYHNGACGFAFADGHSEIKKWRNPNTKRPVLRQQSPGGIVAPEDVAWVWQRTYNQ